MESHIKILGWIYLVLGVLGLLAGLLVAVSGVGAGLLAGMGDAASGLIVGGFTLFAAIVVLICTLPSVLAGWGLLQRKPWARVLAIIVGVFSLIGFPLGTVLGAYTLWVMFQDDAKYVLSA